MNKLKKKRGEKKLLSEISDKAREELKKKFVEYCKNEEKAREQFATKHGLTLEELNEIISLNKKKNLKEKSASTATEEQKTAEKAPTKRVPAKKAPAKKA